MHQRELAAEYPGPQRVVEVIDWASGQFGDRELIVTPTDRLSFGEVDRASRALAERLIAAGVGKGTRVGVHLPHSAEWMVAFFAVTRIGATFMSFSAAYKPAELRRALQLGDVQLLLGATESWHGGPYARFLEEALPELGTSASPVLRCTDVPFLREIRLVGPGGRPSWAGAVSFTVDGAEVDGAEAVGVSDALLEARTRRLQNGNFSPGTSAVIALSSRRCRS